MGHAIVVTGATGKQGKGVVHALLDHQTKAQSDTTIQIYAVTRRPDSEAAKFLASKAKTVHLLKGDFAKPKEIIASVPGEAKASWSIYILSNPGKNEVAETKALIDGALEKNVSHIVYSSVCRGSTNNGNNPSGVDHWQTKHEIEAYLREVCSKVDSAVTYTIIRSVFLLDNLAIPGFFGKFSATLWSDFISPCHLKVIDPSDVGKVTAAAFLDRSSPLFRKNIELTLCGDELTFEKANKIFKRKVGYEMPTTNKWLVSSTLFMMKDFGRMTEVLAKEGFGAPIGSGVSGIKLRDFGDWVDNSRFVDERP